MSDLSEFFPMDFVGAAQSEREPAIIDLSRDYDDHMDCVSTDCVRLCVIFSSDEESENIELMARCVERQLADPIHIPTTGTTMAQKRSGTPRPNQPPFPTFDRRYFNLGRGNSLLAIDNRVRNNHPFYICRNLIPRMDTPLSPSIEDRRPNYRSSAPSCSYSTDSVSVESISNYFNGMAVSETPALVNCSDCVVCGKSIHRIQSEAVNDYLNKTVNPG